MFQKIIDNAKELFYGDYSDNISHRFYCHSVAVLFLLIYELLRIINQLISKGIGTYIEKYESSNLWFFPLQFIPGKSLIVSLGLAGYLGYWVYLDYNGKKDASELGMRDAKKIMKPHWRWNWLHVLTMVLEGLFFAALMFTFLPYITDFMRELLTPGATIESVSPSSIYHYESSYLQSLGVAFGASVYEELIFRVLLIKELNKRLAPFFPPEKKMFHFIDIEDKKFQKRKLYAASLFGAAFIYSLSHIILGDTFQFYTLFYRMIYAILLSFILIKRKFGIAVITHTWYEIFYISFPNVVE
jgi:membrane protease YdiL (CAAX protease family)